MKVGDRVALDGGLIGKVADIAQEGDGPPVYIVEILDLPDKRRFILMNDGPDGPMQILT